MTLRPKPIEPKYSDIDIPDWAGVFPKLKSRVRIRVGSGRGRPSSNLDSYEPAMRELLDLFDIKDVHTTSLMSVGYVTEHSGVNNKDSITESLAVPIESGRHVAQKYRLDEDTLRVVFFLHPVDPDGERNWEILLEGIQEHTAEDIEAERAAFRARCDALPLQREAWVRDMAVWEVEAMEYDAEKAERHAVYLRERATKARAALV